MLAEVYTGTSDFPIFFSGLKLSHSTVKAFVVGKNFVALALDRAHTLSRVCNLQSVVHLIHHSQTQGEESWTPQN